MNLQLVTIALSPAIALIWLFYARSAYRPEGRLVIGVLFVLGFASGGLALVLNHLVERYTMLWAGAPDPVHRLLFWVLGIGLNEEFAKMVMLLAVMYPRRNFTTPIQGLLAGATVAMGFAAIENLFYLERYGTVNLLIRSVLTVPAHASFTAPLGAAMAYSKRARTLPRKVAWLAGGLGFALGVHGLYDIWLSLDSQWLNYLAYVQVVVMVAFVMLLMRLRPPPLVDPDPGEAP